MNFKHNPWHDGPQDDNNKLPEEKKIPEIDKISEKESIAKQKETQRDTEKKGTQNESKKNRNTLGTQHELSQLQQEVPANFDKQEKREINVVSNNTDYVEKFQEQASFSREYNAHEYEQCIVSAKDAPEKQNSLSAIGQSCSYVVKTFMSQGKNVVIDSTKFREYKYLPEYIIENA